MSDRRTYNPRSKDQVFDTLRREILAARLKVTLDEQLKRTTSQTVKRLAQMKLPPLVRSNDDATVPLTAVGIITSPEGESGDWHITFKEGTSHRHAAG